MKSFFKPAALLFYFLTILTFFFAGLYYAGLTGKGENQGLAAGAIVIGYGVMFAGLALVAALFFTFYLADYLKRANRILFALLVVFVLVTTWRFMKRQSKVERENISQPLLPTTEAAMNLVSAPAESSAISIGLGMFKPDFYNQRVMYFYGNPNLKKAVNEHYPIDSLVFERTETGVTIAYAPPWFDPAHLKLDYEMLWMQVRSAGMGFVEVVGNERNQMTYYVNQSAGRLYYWPEFLLTVHSIEFLENHHQTIRIKPLDHASEVSGDYFILQPMMVRGDWIQVSLKNNEYKEVETGWVRWRNGQEVIVRWSLLS